jgi:hypothetical protein
MLKDLIYLRLGPADRDEDDIILDVGGYRETLQKFSSRSCTDSDIEILANNCKKLDGLDISFSTDVTYKAVEYILKIEGLEELNLYEVHSISEEALDVLLEGLSERNLPIDEAGPSEPTQSTEAYTTRPQKLRHFGCNNPTKHHISILSNAFTNIYSLHLSNVNCSLTPLTSLRILYSFSLSNSRFEFARELLLAKGSETLCLNLINVVDTDFNFLVENCRKLVCLHLCFTRKRYLILSKTWSNPGACWISSPTFPSVQYLQVSLKDLKLTQYVVTCFQNLRRLVLDGKVDQVFLDCLLHRFHHLRLEEIIWGNDLELTIKRDVASVKTVHSDGKRRVEHIVLPAVKERVCRACIKRNMLPRMDKRRLSYSYTQMQLATL